MVVNKRSKNSRLRASHTHGWGSKKKHRGAGNRGGRGRAGSGKKADQRKPSLWKHEKLGRYGFTSIHSGKNKPINISEIEDKLATWVKAKKVEEKAGVLTVDLRKLGFTKLLSRGKAQSKLAVVVDEASAKAVEKVTAAGGSVQVSGAKKDDLVETTNS